MGEGHKRAQAEARARIADESRLRMNDAAMRLAMELRRTRRLLTINRLLCVAALAGWAWTVMRHI